MKNLPQCLTALAFVAALIGTQSSASAQLFGIRNESKFTVSVGLAYTDWSCDSDFRNQLWTNVEPGDSTQVSIDLTNPVLVTAIIAGDHGWSTLMILDQGNLGNYWWDAPLTGSNDCATFGVEPHYEFGYAQFTHLSTICSPGSAREAGLMISDDVTGPLRPYVRVGCLDLSGAPGRPVFVEPEVGVP